MYDFCEDRTAVYDRQQAVEIVNTLITLLVYDLSKCYDFAFSFSNGTTHHS